MASENGKEIKFSNQVNIVNDYLSNNLNDKKLLGKIYTSLKMKSLGNDEQLLDINQKIREYINEVIYDEDIELEQETNIDPLDLFKGVGLRIVEEEDDELSNFVRQIELSEEYLNISMHFFINLREFFNSTELIAIYNGLLLKKIKFILIESSYRGKIDDREKIFLIDEDLCEL